MTEQVRIRGMYATAVTLRCLDAGFEVVDPSPAIADRLEPTCSAGVPDVTVRDTSDRLGLEVSGTPAEAMAVRDVLGSISRDSLTWSDELARGTVWDGELVETRDGGAIVRTGDGEGFLPYGRVDASIESGDRLPVQVIDPEPPWTAGRRAVLGAEIRVPGTYVSLVRDVSFGVRAPDGALARTVERLNPDVPDGWGVRVHHRASDVGPMVIREELESLRGRAETDDPYSPVTGWCRIGREGRFELDTVRARATPTVEGHHRMKTIGDAAGSAVDLIEAHDPESFPFDADVLLDAFGPHHGDRVRIEHGKPDGTAIDLGTGVVTSRDVDAGITVERGLSGGGRYDALDVPKEDGDRAVTTFVEGRWWYPTIYRDADGTHKGTYVNVGTPLEVLPDRVGYVDLHVDVLKSAAGDVSIVDRDELSSATERGTVPPEIQQRAIAVAESVANGL